MSDTINFTFFNKKSFSKNEFIEFVDYLLDKNLKDSDVEESFHEYFGGFSYRFFLDGVSSNISIHYYTTSKEFTIFFPDYHGVEKILIKLIKKISNKYNFNGVGSDDYSVDDPDGIQNMETLASVILFSLEDVKKYGKDKLLKAPCELIEEWENGSIFMMIKKYKFSSKTEQRKKLREHLGVK